MSGQGSCYVLLRLAGIAAVVTVVCVAAWSLFAPTNASGGLLESLVVSPLDSRATPLGTFVLPDVPRGSARRKRPVLILQMDDRPLQSELVVNVTTYTSMSVVINYHYALKHASITLAR